MLLLSAMVEILSFLPSLTDDLLLAAVYGGVLVGGGIWLVFRCRGTTGGTALAALLLNRGFGVTAGQGLLLSDILIIITAAAVFGLEAAMYAAISLAVSSWVIDIIEEGAGVAKVALIITEKSTTVAERIFKEIDRGVTFMQSRGGYTGKERDAILCVVSRAQISQLKHLVYEHDPHAFMIVGNASEALGEGFIEDARRKQES